MRCEVCDDRQVLADELVPGDSVLCTSTGDSPRDLYNKRRRVGEYVAAESDQGPRFPNDEAVRKLLYLALRNIAKKWTMPVTYWKAVLNRFAIVYENRLPAD